MQKLVRRLVHYGHSLAVVIPRAVLLKLAWRPGDYLIMEPLDDGVRIRRLAWETVHEDRTGKPEGEAP